MDRPSCWSVQKDDLMWAQGQRRLIAIGVLLGVLAAVLILVIAGRQVDDRRPSSVPAALLPEADGALAEVVLHYVPELDAVLAEPYTDFLQAIDGDVRVVFVVPEGMGEAGRRTLDERLAAIDSSGGLAARSTIVSSPGPITPWSKDRALVTKPDSSNTAWLLPPAEPDAKRWPERHNDWRTIGSLAAALDGYDRKEAPFEFDAGDFAVDGDRVIVDADLLEKNRGRGITDVEQLRARLRAWLGMEVMVLGQKPGDTPKHHLAMYMTPLHDRIALVGDPRAARDIVGADFAPGAVSAETGEPLRADFSERTMRRFEHATLELEHNGHRVVRIPNVPFDDKTYITYTNGVYETRGGQRIVYLPVYGIEPLDGAAERIYEELGWSVRRIRVRSVYPHHGTIGCLVNVLRRRASDGGS